MIQSFKHKGLEKFFVLGKTAGINADHARRFRLILARLSASQRPGDMALPGLRLHPLKGDLKGYFSVVVNGNWRVIFRFEGPDAVDVDYVDYH
jgi:proteic killer suppression protein